MKKDKKAIFILVLAVVIFMSIAWLFDVFSLLRMKAIDFYFNARGPIQSHSDIIIVAIDDMSVKEFGVWPWPRSYHARLINFLKKAQAKAIGFDATFADNSPDPIDDKNLIEATKVSGIVYHAMYFSPERRIRAETKKVSIIVTTETEKEIEKLLPDFSMSVENCSDLSIPEAGEATIPIPDLIKVSRGIGSINYEPEIDGVVRYAKLVFPFKGKYYPSLSVCLAAQCLGVEQKDIKLCNEGIEIGTMKIPFNSQGKMLINYTGGTEKFKFIPYYRVITGEIPIQEFKDKIVLVGSTAVGAYDLRVTPYSSNFPGIGVHANIISSILNKKLFTQLPKIIGFILIVILGIIMGLVLPRLSPLFTAVFTAALFILLILSGVFLFSRGYYLDIVYPGGMIFFGYLSISLFRFISEEKEKQEIKSVFNVHVSPAVVNELLSDPGKCQLFGTRKYLTVLFADIRGFTTISEKMQPEEVVALLNECFTELSDVVFKFDGFLDKFIGDALLAVFGTPIAHKDDALRAVRTAWEMQQKINEIEKKHSYSGLQIGIGINSGDVVAGNMGSQKRMNYTVIGDNVNLAQRLEDMAKGGQILISEETYRLVYAIVNVNKLEPVVVKGKTQAVQIYEVTEVR